MKLNLNRMAAAVLAVGFALSLSACSGSSSAASSESASSEAAAESTEPSFDYSAGIDENGYWEGIKALDYVVLPEDYAAMPVPANVSSVSEESIQSYLDQVTSSFTTSEPVEDGVVTEGDTVNIDYEGKVDGVAFDGGAAEAQDIVAADGKGYIDGFGSGLIGHKVDETFDVPVTFPEDNSSAELAGKDAVFTMTIHSVSRSVTPELTDAFVAANLSENLGFNTVQELRDYFEENIRMTQESDYVLQQLLAESTFSQDLPQSMLDYREAFQIASMAQQAASYNMAYEDFRNMYGYESDDAMLEAMQENITSAVKQSLILQAIAEDQKLEIAQEDLDTVTGSNYDTYKVSFGDPFIRMNAVQMCAEDFAVSNIVTE